jgi:ubiquinone/menaquinone biosynthesis C-methylase UbiE
MPVEPAAEQRKPASGRLPALGGMEMIPADAEARSAEIWDRLAAHYDRQLWFERAAIRRALDLAAVQRRDRVLDVGTGTGLVLRELAGRHERPASAVGIDFGPPWRGSP